MKQIKINRTVYSDNAVKAALEAYRDFAVITEEFKDEYVILTFEKCRYDEEQTTKEFENYMIEIENS